MRKKFLIILLGCLFLTGCGANSEKNVLKKITKNIEDSKSYYVEGTMELINNEDIFTYDVNASYEKKDNYKIELTNISNKHKQIILRNEDGVYVVTPSLNKSFKFQSDWPYNNSQVYLLQSVIENINNDEEKTFEKKDDKYIFTSKVNYPNNDKLYKQIVTVNKDYKIEKVEVVDKDNNTQITMKYNKIDLNSKFNDDYFELDELIDDKEEIDTKETATLDDIIYPMYLPVNTYLSSQESINTASGKRLILTFDGDNPFTLIEEVAITDEEHEIIPTYGEIELLGDSIAVVNDNSVNWISNGIEYFVVSNVMDSNELLEVAKSISVIPVASVK